MNPTSNTRSTQILTEKIELDNNLDPHILIKEQISRKFKDTKVYAVSVDYDNTTDSKKTVLENPFCSNGFAAAIIHAYNHHKHLRLSPDDVWLTISQGVSRHINYNAEKFRNRFVQHEGKKEIRIGVQDILNGSTLEGNWPEAVNRLVIKTDKNVEKIDLKELLECDFSTTTLSSLTASRIVLLDMVKAYFKYICCFECGIPKVTLEGTLEDWMKLQEKVTQLRNLNLELDFWLDRLEPVVCNLVATYRGEINEDFWSRIIKINTPFGSGRTEPYITGWLASFFPYDSSGTPLNSEHLEVTYIPDGFVGVPFETDIGHKLKFVAGFIGANQEILEDFDGESVVSPVIGWTVINDVDVNVSSDDKQDFKF
ncbi:8675_t:CDS:1 [Dentiscutata erythropus]|uniref:8675_t:CDS:1 n=1 Tax=Dentiscutata erythropus TaxID=1348616 RepID=A0A9N9E0X4_9GLOM|nr:8675_t:CDS:1 [Dentiscutata erythropus]